MDMDIIIQIIRENPSCPSKTDIFNNSCQGFSNTYSTKSSKGDKYMHIKHYKLKEGFTASSLLSKLRVARMKIYKILNII